MKKRFDKKLMQKGGMMIEALAMLGLIAVVTPTMYKKSAERTLEVEDINTATTMRSVMSAADSYISANYGELVQQIPHDDSGVGYKKISMSKLKPYLPYSFNENKLYDFGAPKMAIARQGNNLTAFVLFPAKADADDGLGQERTVRIATLVGANGGYINSTNNAKGIGGIWSLSQDELNTLFGSDARNIYSIVTASSDAINNTNTEEDTDKFLYRTDKNGKWHNTMRADLYLGGFIPTEDDSYIRTDDLSQHNMRKNYSIRDVKRLIIGTNSVTNYTGNAEIQDELDAAEIGDETNKKFGLYMKDSSEDGIDSAFIFGTLEAADSNLVVNNTSLMFRKPEEAEGLFHFKVDDSSLRYGTEGNVYNFKVSDSGVITNSNDVILASVEPTSADDAPTQKWKNVKIGRLGQNATGTTLARYLISGNMNAGAGADASGSGVLSLIDSDTVEIKGKKKNGNDYSVDFADRIVVNKNGTKGDSNTWTGTINYTNSQPIPEFPVRFGSNVKVEGILATPQIDVQKLRTAEIEVGSTNINDQYKWLTVDANGIHGRNPSAVDADANKTDTVLDVRGQNINLATGTLSRNVTPFNIANGADNALTMVKGGNVELASKNGIDIKMYDDAKELNIKNNTIQEQVKGTDVVFSSLQEAGSETTNVKVKGTNLQVSDKSNNIVFSVKGNNSGDESLDKYTRGNTGTDVADVSAHGEVLFTSSLSSGNADRQYMKVGSNYSNNAMVNIIEKDVTNKKFKQVLSVDGNASHTDNVDTTLTDSGSGGTVYIRKGMVDVEAPTSSYFTSSEGFNNVKTDAEHGYGIVKASRLVANNMPQTINGKTFDNKFSNNFVAYGQGSGNRAVPTKDAYNGYNGSNAVLYDTYMVNPAYTSVMHDIKLTTRGGARLSDILPDFINKGIYITNNTYKDSISKLHFATASDGSVTLASGAGTLEQGDGTINLGESDSWASPYLGFVPAPQCPPGYNRLITLAPQSFMMSQAGQMQRGVHPRGGKAYYVKNQVPDNSAFTEYNQMVSESGAYVSQAFLNTVSASANTDVATSGTVTGNGMDGSYSGSVTLNNVPLTVKASYTDAGGTVRNPSGTDLYFLVSTGDKTPPLTIQQSTWLKTNVIPVGAGATDAYIGHQSGGYTKGWAALMGFVYDNATYKTIIERLGSEHSPIGYDNSGGSVYWNIFPVRRNTLEAYATTYCYFDRTGIMNTLAGDASNYVDQYNALQDYKTNTWQKSSHGNYLQRLNDPTLKYNEVW